MSDTILTTFAQGSDNQASCTHCGASSSDEFDFDLHKKNFISDMGDESYLKKRLSCFVATAICKCRFGSFWVPKIDPKSFV